MHLSYNSGERKQSGYGAETTFKLIQWPNIPKLTACLHHGAQQGYRIWDFIRIMEYPECDDPHGPLPGQPQQSHPVPGSAEEIPHLTPRAQGCHRCCCVFIYKQIKLVQI